MSAPGYHPTAIEAFPEAMLVVDEHGTIREANSAATTLLDAAKSALIGRSLQELVVDLPETVARNLRNWARSGQLVPGALTFRGSPQNSKMRVEGGRLGRSLGASVAPLLLRLMPAMRASASFIELNERLNRLHAEIAARERVQRELQRSRQELQESHENLEARVQNRTQELLAVTAQLKREIEHRTGAEDRLRELSGRLLNLRDEERRRLARELHDSIGQLLAAVQLNLALVESTAPEMDAQNQRRVAECASLTEQAIREVRTISYLLHPPMLDEAGLAMALRWYVDGFVERSRIKIDLQLPDPFPRLPQEVETAVFRIAQEALTNIYRHSGSKCASLQLVAEGDKLRLRIRDEGIGIPPEKLGDPHNGDANFGMGLRGMRERVRHLGGVFRITASRPGTAIDISIPLAQARLQSAQVRSV